MALPPLITLRPATPDDAAAHAQYTPSAEIIRMYGGDPNAPQTPSLRRSEHWLTWLMDHPFGRLIERDGVLVGHIRLHSLDRRDRRARLAIGLFADRFLGQGIGRQAIDLTLDHAFGHMGLHRVDLRVLGFNTRAIRCYRACGFVHEGTEREGALVDGQWQDDWIMSILSHEFAARQP